MYLGALYIEGPNGCWPKSSEFQLVGLLEIVKLGPRALYLGPRALYWGPTQTSYYSTWRPTWPKFGAKTLSLTKENGPRFSLPKLQNLGPIDSIEPPRLDEIHLRRWRSHLNHIRLGRQRALY
jgi:hypothetical protein